MNSKGSCLLYRNVKPVGTVLHANVSPSFSVQTTHVLHTKNVFVSHNKILDKSLYIWVIFKYFPMNHVHMLLLKLCRYTITLIIIKFYECNGLLITFSTKFYSSSWCQQQVCDCSVDLPVLRYYWDSENDSVNTIVKDSI